MSEQLLFLDLETRPNPTLKDLWIETHQKEYNTFVDGQLRGIDALTLESEISNFIQKQMATNTDFCEVALIGIKQLDGEVRILDDMRKLGDPAWARLLQQMSLCTFNGKSYDLPIIIKQGLKLGLDLPYKRLMNACKKWGYGERHIDLMEILAFGGRWATLDTYLQVYLGIKKETKGDEFFRNATLEELKKHCEQDLYQTEQLFKFFETIL